MLAAKNFIYYDKNFTAWFVFAIIKKTWAFEKKSAREVLFVEILFLWTEQKIFICRGGSFITFFYCARRARRKVCILSP